MPISSTWAWYLCRKTLLASAWVCMIVFTCVLVRLLFQSVPRPPARSQPAWVCLASAHFRCRIYFLLCLCHQQLNWGERAKQKHKRRRKNYFFRRGWRRCTCHFFCRFLLWFLLFCLSRQCVRPPEKKKGGRCFSSSCDNESVSSRAKMSPNCPRFGAVNVSMNTATAPLTSPCSLCPTKSSSIYSAQNSHNVSAGGW